MKALMIAASAAAMAFAATPSLAQQEGGMYGSIGYAATDREDAKLGAVQGRFGVKLHPMFGIEGEGAFGVQEDEVLGADVKLSHQLAAYGVGFLPVGERFEVLGRVGYGNTKIEVETPLGSADADANSWNYGAGAQFFFTEADAIRADWTRHNFDEDENDGDLDVWSVAYVRRF